jgi:hypothetical protein
MNRFTDLALDKNALDFQDLFQEVLSQKVSDALDAKKVEIAATMFEDPAIAEEKIEMTRGGRATGNAIADIVAKNNARLSKKKADRAKHLRKKEKYDGGVKEEVELDEGMIDHIAKIHVHGSNVTLHMHNGKKSTQRHPSPEAALKDGRAYHKATGREAKLVIAK